MSNSSWEEMTPAGSRIAADDLGSQSRTASEFLVDQLSPGPQLEADRRDIAGAKRSGFLERLIIAPDDEILAPSEMTIGGNRVALIRAHRSPPPLKGLIGLLNYLKAHDELLEKNPEPRSTNACMVTHN